MQSTTIASYVTKEMEVGIMIVTHQVGTQNVMEVENRFNHINEESLEVGSITEKHNGKRKIRI
jgi:hypothetical protein